MLIVKIVWLIAEIAKVWQKETKLMKISRTSLIKNLMLNKNLLKIKAQSWKTAIQKSKFWSKD